MKILTALAELCALLAGILLTAITLLTCFSVLGRNTWGSAINGDFELTGVAAGAAIALFLPLCQIKRGNIIVDFFTAKASDQLNARFDRIGAFILGACMLLLAWRSAIGGMAAWANQSGSMMLGFPEWIVYAMMVPPITLSGVIGITQSLVGFEAGETA